MTYFKNISYKLETIITDLVGNFVSGLIVNYEIRKCSDDSVISSGTMSEVNSVYVKEITFTEVGEYRVKYITPEGYENGFENIVVDEYDNYKVNISDIWSYVTRTLTSGGGSGGLTPEQDSRLTRIAGLSQENYRIFNPTYVTKNHQSCMTLATIKIYPTATDCNADINATAEYRVDASFDNQAKMIDYKVTKI